MKNPFSQYVDNQINTATPGRLVVLAYDGAIRFAKAGLEAMKARKLDKQSEGITKAQTIVTELMSCWTIRPTRVGASLSCLYTYMFDRLTEANIRDNGGAIEEVIGLLSDLRSAWADAELVVRSGRTQEVQAA